MSLAGDYLEAGLGLEYVDEETRVDLYVTFRDRTMQKFDNVRHDPVRMHRMWTIGYDFAGRPATAVIPAEDVWYFTVVEVAR